MGDNLKTVRNQYPHAQGFDVQIGTSDTLPEDEKTVVLCVPSGGVLRYTLDPAELAEALNAIPGFRAHYDQPVPQGEYALLQEKDGSETYIRKGENIWYPVSVSPHDRLTDHDMAKLLRGGGRIVFEGGGKANG